MKRLIIILLGLCVSFSLFACSGKQPVGSLTEISYDTCETLFESESTFMLVVSQTTCEECKAYKELLKEYVSTNKIDIVYIEADKDTEAFQTLWDKRFPSVENTPTTMVVVNGVIKDSVVGALNEEQVSLLLERNNVFCGSLSEISYEKADAWFKSEKDFIFIISQTTCETCSAYKKHLLEYIKELPVDFVYIEADRDFDTFESLLWDVYFPEVEDTPTTCVVKDGKIVDSVVGDLTVEQLKIFFERNDVEVTS